jgi:hypothetical protein
MNNIELELQGRVLSFCADQNTAYVPIHDRWFTAAHETAGRKITFINVSWKLAQMTRSNERDSPHNLAVDLNHKRSKPRKFSILSINP